jgi:hypothetical protein
LLFPKLEVFQRRQGETVVHHHHAGSGGLAPRFNGTAGVFGEL